MSKREEIALRAADALENGAEGFAQIHGLIGFDGFVDEIIHVVDKRYSVDHFDRIDDIPEFGNRIVAAGGKSANFELVLAQDATNNNAPLIKLGGNGPIMANAISHLGMGVQYVGNLGEESLHPVFRPLEKRMEVVSVAAPGQTLALEFADGKLMLGRRDSLKDVTWERVVSRVGRDRLFAMVERSAFLAAVNWTMLPFMDEILDGLIEEALPATHSTNKTFFFDLADPAMRPTTALLNTVQGLKRFGAFGRVILGLNLSEAKQVASVLDLAIPPESPEGFIQLASAIRARLDLYCVVVHPTFSAAAATADATGYFAGPYTKDPVITTGAGDHFNAGFCTAQLLGMPLEESLAVATGTSGYYVRTTVSPNPEQLTQFLRSLPEPERP